jgi:hypothetical protein
LLAAFYSDLRNVDRHRPTQNRRSADPSLVGFKQMPLRLFNYVAGFVGDPEATLTLRSYHHFLALPFPVQSLLVGP